jgi:DNA-binding CsgD family transcriptional regulator
MTIRPCLVRDLDGFCYQIYDRSMHVLLRKEVRTMWRGHEGRFLTQDALERRASGRRHYNSMRHFRALERQRQVAHLMASGIRRRAEIARRLRVHPSTISRDIQALLALQPGACPTCGRPYVRPADCAP